MQASSNNNVLIAFQFPLIAAMGHVVSLESNIGHFLFEEEKGNLLFKIVDRMNEDEKHGRKLDFEKICMLRLFIFKSLMKFSLRTNFACTSESCRLLCPHPCSILHPCAEFSSGMKRFSYFKLFISALKEDTIYSNIFDCEKRGATLYVRIYQQPWK